MKSSENCGTTSILWSPRNCGHHGVGIGILRPLPLCPCFVYVVVRVNISKDICIHTSKIYHLEFTLSHMIIKHP